MAPPTAMVDKLAFAIQECTFMTSVMRNSARTSAGPLSALLGNQFARDGSPAFLDDEKLPSFLKTGATSKEDNHFVSGFVELRSILSEVETLDDVDLMTLLQPFLLLIKSPKISCYITSVAVNSLEMFIKYGIVDVHQKGIREVMSQVVSALSHCRFEGSDQSQDDILLVKILQLLETIVVTDLGSQLQDDSMYDIVSTCFSVAINTRRRDMLRSAADTSLLNITAAIFGKLKDLEDTRAEDHNIKSTGFELDEKDLPSDTIGTQGSKTEVNSEEADASTDVNDETEAPTETAAVPDPESSVEDESKKDANGTHTELTEGEANDDDDDDDTKKVVAAPAPFKEWGLPCLREYLVHTVDILSPEGRFRFTESTRLLALEIVARVVEVAGPVLEKFPSLYPLISDKCCHHLVQLIQATDSSVLLPQALKIFLALLINSPDNLKVQFEFFFQTILNGLVADQKMMEKDLETTVNSVFGMSKKGSFEAVDLSEEEVARLQKEFSTGKQSHSKELLIETPSVLWCRTPYIFINLFKDYDCDFDRSDIAIGLIKVLCRLSQSDAAAFTTNTSQPLCMEGLLALIDNMYERVRFGQKQGIDMAKVEEPELLKQRSKKFDFIECTKLWNKKPSKGIELLQQKGFIENIHDDKEVAKFLFEKSGRIDKAELGEVLAKPSNLDLLKEFVGQMDFTNLRPDEALRMMLNYFRLPGEAQQIERIVEAFNTRYIETQNSVSVEENTADNGEEPTESEAKATALAVAEAEAEGDGEGDGEGKTDAQTVSEEDEKVTLDQDGLFVLSYSIIMLNTDLHNPNVKKPMSLEEYQRNLRGCYNGKDFPSWYTERIYQSIRDKEIILPEDFKGSAKWFESEWNSLIESKANSELGSFVTKNGESLSNLLQYDSRIFGNVAKYVISSIVTMFDSAAHDSVVTRMMSTLEKCATIANYFGLDDIVDDLVEVVSHMTTLTGVKKSQITLDSDEEIPVIEMEVENKEGEKETITVSERSVLFGRDLRAQISLIVLLRIIKRSNYRVSNSWKFLTDIIPSLLESGLLGPNAFPEFQTKLNLPSLPTVKPQYTLNRTKSLKDSGLFSTFSSYLKGLSDDTPEPTDEEIESTLATLECTRSSNIADLFRNVSKTDPENIDRLVRILIDSLPSKETRSERGWLERTMYTMELCVCNLLLSGNKELINDVLKKLDELQDPELKIPSKQLARLTAYELLLLQNLGDEGTDNVQHTLDRMAGKLESSRDSFLQSSPLTMEPFQVLLLGQDNELKSLAQNPKYWTLMRAFASVPKNTSAAYEFANALITKHPDLVNSKNYMDVLGLLDEISAVGAYGAQWEQESEKLQASGVDVGKKQNPFQELVTTASKSIALTSKLTNIIERPDFNGIVTGQDKSLVSPWYPLIEAISHQCYNPCRELRADALKALTNLLVSGSLPMEKLSPESVLEAGCFRLLIELANPEVTSTDPKGMLQTQQDVINLTCKTLLLLQFEDLNKEVIKLLTLTSKLLLKNKNKSDFSDEVIEIIGNALTVKADELDLKRLRDQKIAPQLKKMLDGVQKAQTEKTAKAKAEAEKEADKEAGKEAVKEADKEADEEADKEADKEAARKSSEAAVPGDSDAQ